MKSMRGMSSGFPPIQSMAAKLALALIAGSILFAMTRAWFGALLLLSPNLVFGGMIWQPLTYVWIETSPLGVLFGALITWSIGGALEQTWGGRRMALFAVGISVVAGLLTLLLAWPVRALWTLSFAGGTVMTTTLWVGYGLAFANRQINFWGLPVTGHVFALIGVGFVFLNGAFGSWLAIIPDAFGIALTFFYLKVGSPRVLLLRFQSWRLQRQLRARSRHLRVVERGRNMPRDSDRFLH